MPFVYYKILNYFILGVRPFCDRGITSNNNLGATFMFYKTKII